MEKLRKSLIVILTITIVMSIFTLFNIANVINKEIEKPEILAYNHRAENALDNLYRENDKLILPFILDSIGDDASKEIISMDQIIEEFRKSGLNVSNISTSNIGTGTVINVDKHDTPYNVLIYGDVNGDGKVNLIDVQRVLTHYLNPSTRALEGLYAVAGNVVNTNEEINLIDVQRLLVFYLGNRNDYVVNEPESIKEKDFITDMSISKPQKKVYTLGEELDLTGGQIHLQYDSGRVETFEINRDMIINFDTYDKDTIGKYNMTVVYKTANTGDGLEKEFTASFEVEVRKPLGLYVNDGIKEIVLKSGDIDSAVKEDYTLMPIYRVDYDDEGNEVTSHIKISDIVQLQPSTGEVSIKDTISIKWAESGADIEFIAVKAFNEDKNEILQDEVDDYASTSIYYIGVILNQDLLDLEDVEDGHIVIYDHGKEVSRIHFTHDKQSN